MGWPTSESGAVRGFRLLVLTAGLLCSAVSLLYLLVPVIPLYYFHGYVRGYYALLDYKLHYVHDQQPVPMPHTDYIKHVVTTFTALSAALLVLSLASVVLASRKPLTVAGLVYGVASGLVVLYGLLNGYIYRAVSFDIGRFSYFVKDKVVSRTLAGTVIYEGVKLESLPLNDLVFATPAQAILLALTVVASATAAGFAISKAYKERTAGTSPWVRSVKAYSALSLASFTLLASVFAYYPWSIGVVPQPPPATLEPPPYTYTCTALARSARGAITYTDFETYPLTGWTSSGGIWSTASGVTGAKGNVLRGQDNDRGVGDASHYYYNTDLSGTSSLWVAAKTRLASDTGRYGISMINTARSRLYEVSINTSGYLQIRSFNVIAPPANRWTTHTSVTIPGYTSTAWYVVVVYYSVVGTTITIHAYLYDATGSYVTEASSTITHTNVFRPAYLGVTVDELTAYFDDFIVSTSDPRSILFTGFTSGMRVEVWDNLGVLVNYTVAPATTFYLSVTADTVVGTGVDGRIVARYPDAYPCGVLAVPATDAVLGGDTYALASNVLGVALGANETSATVSASTSGSPWFNTTARVLRINAHQTIYARLILNSVSAPSTLNLDVWIEGITRSTNITIRSGVPISDSTSFVQLKPGLESGIALSGHFTATGYSATLGLRLELCTAPEGMGACVHYPLYTYIRA